MRWLAAGVLAFHLAWILWVIFGALLTRGRPWLAGFHIASIVWGIIAEIGPWSCPLTLLEDHLETATRGHAYAGDCLVHYLDSIVYPNLSVRLIVGCAIAVCSVNLAVYAMRGLRALRRRPAER
jgi:hypothetical protein